MKIQLFKGRDGWRWRLKGRNGEIVATSEAYARKHNAIRAVGRLNKLFRTPLKVTYL